MEAREAILCAGERLIAERGPGIPLRDVALQAGQRNNSAVHYYFGSRDGLIQAIVERRVESLEKYQLDLLTEYETTHTYDDLRGLVDTLVRPLFRVPYAQGATHYGRFLEQVRNYPVISQAQLDVDHWPTTRMITARLGKALRHLPTTSRRRRLTSMSTVLFALLADEERRREAEGADAGTDVVDEVVSMLVGLLTAD